MASWIAFFGFGLGILATNNGLLEPIQRWLRGFVLGAPDAVPTLPGLLGVSPWVVIAAFVLGGGAWLWRGRASGYQGGWGWAVAGLAIGVVGIVAWPLSGLTGRPFGLSVTEPTYNLMRLFALGHRDALGWGLFMWLGIPLGSYWAARRAGEFKWRAPGPTRLLQALGGGVVMGIGAAIAGGCTVGHSLTGASVLAMTSLVATASIVLGVWSAAFVLFRT